MKRGTVMDKNTISIMQKKIARTTAALEKNGYTVICVDKKEDVIGAITPLLPKGCTVAVGGSMSLFEAGVIDYLRSADCTFLDRYAAGITPEGVKEVFKNSMVADVYISSTNALTEDGKLVNVDGNGNRVAAMIYGPDSVIVVVGCNKIAKNVDDAMRRIEEVASPANTTRLSCKTPCVEFGRCVDCKGDTRICNHYTISGRLTNKGRVKVVLVAEELGY